MIYNKHIVVVGTPLEYIYDKITDIIQHLFPSTHQSHRQINLKGIYSQK